MRKRLKSATVAAAALAVLLAGCGDDPTTTTTEPTGPDLGRAPASVSWHTYQGMKLPVGGEDGPKDASSAAAHGYSQTPQGAALAAINAQVRMSIATDADWSKVAAVVLATGPGKDHWVLNRAQVSVVGGVDETAPKISGYKVNSYSPDKAEIAVYSTFPDNSVSEAKATVIWFAHDWRLQLPDPAAKVVTISEVPTVPADAVRLEATA